ncbi:DUF4091 domain-containing protein [Vallitalea okinawensis]|uniref:DUF4091 domain-containing protein n=1 Tax=Vallitalea okinawensis TaxID=2078660 RepID=UPI000CFD8DA2|nr:DUF4091 domain-containing protein [Vallitalea okinawensis]
MLKCKLERESFKYVYGMTTLRTDFFKESIEIKEVCGKNDWSAVQVLLESDKDMLVTINNDPRFYKKRAVDCYRLKVTVEGIPDESIKVQLVDLVEDDDHQLKSDILLDEQSIFVKAGKIQCVWVEIKTDNGVEPGHYEPKVSIYKSYLFEDEVLYNQLNYSLDVFDHTMKKPEDFRFYLDLWQHNSNIARKYEVPLWGEEHFSIIDNYIASLADLGQKAVSLIVSEIPWSGQNSLVNPIDSSDLYEYNMVRCYKNEEELKFDFNILDRYVELCDRHGINQEYEVFGLINVWTRPEAGFDCVIEGYDDGIRIRYYDESDQTFKYIRKKVDYERYLQALEQYFADKGIIDRVRIIADEPADIEEYKNRLSFLKKVTPKFKFKAAINHVEFMQEDIPDLMDYCPNIRDLTKEFQRFQEIKDSCQGTISYYVCCGPKNPNTFISSPLLESRVIPWFAYLLGTDGFLRWNYTVWPDQPREKISYAYPEWAAGDTNFVYPGKTGKPMLTLRYKNLLRGIGDYEYLMDLKEANVSTDEFLDEIFYNRTKIHEEYYKNDNYCLESEVYQSVKRKMLELLSNK